MDSVEILKSRYPEVAPTLIDKLVQYCQQHRIQNLRSFLTSLLKVIQHYTQNPKPFRYKNHIFSPLLNIYSSPLGSWATGINSHGYVFLGSKRAGRSFTNLKLFYVHPANIRLDSIYCLNTQKLYPASILQTLIDLHLSSFELSLFFEEYDTFPNASSPLKMLSKAYTRYFEKLLHLHLKRQFQNKHIHLTEMQLDFTLAELWLLYDFLPHLKSQHILHHYLSQFGFQKTPYGYYKEHAGHCIALINSDIYIDGHYICIQFIHSPDIPTEDQALAKLFALVCPELRYSRKFTPQLSSYYTILEEMFDANSSEKIGFYRAPDPHLYEP
ncbi:MAG: hypothetical protein ACTSYB_12030 [Candidatus Helarchaeota archaeon]